MIIIRNINYEDFKEKNYSIIISSNKYLNIKKVESGFDFEWIDSTPFNKILKDEILSDWLDNPIAYGAYDNNELIGFIEGFKEEWNNRFRITNICIFNDLNRKKGIGKLLLDKILEDAKKLKTRMVVLETQSYNYNAIKFYEKNGFEIIGFDLFAYTNNLDDHNIRIEMGRKID